MNFYQHFIITFIVTVLIISFFDVKDHLSPRQNLALFVIGMASGVLIDLDHFIWGALHMGNFNMATGCLASFKTCLSKPHLVFTEAGLPAGSIRIRNTIHIVSIILMTSAATTYTHHKPEKLGRYPLIAVVAGTTLAHLAADWWHLIT